uniref:Uncharacterized protein n=1 Tax=Ursus americanus TaxID=9643 RepID=A0A452SLH2_URSAM
SAHFSTSICRPACHGGHLILRLAPSGCAIWPFTTSWPLTTGVPGTAVSWSSWIPMIHCATVMVALNLDRIRLWVGSGAHLCEQVEKLLGLSVFFPLHPMMITNAERP